MKKLLGFMALVLGGLCAWFVVRWKTEEIRKRALEAMAKLPLTENFEKAMDAETARITQLEAQAVVDGFRKAFGVQL